jgi:heptaprenylglyceryl phosphate synthase
VPVATNIIKKCKSQLNIPLLIGGGIKTKQQLETTFNAGADMVVIGTAFENNISFFNDLKKQLACHFLK